jgi:hypothetical protein
MIPDDDFRHGGTTANTHRLITIWVRMRAGFKRSWAHAWHETSENELRISESNWGTLVPTIYKDCEIHLGSVASKRGTLKMNQIRHLG